jgi:acyl-CoA hydrolase
MSTYQKINAIATTFLGKSTAYKYGFNLSPMYRRSTAKIESISKDMLRIDIKLPLSYKNKNYVNSIFGGSMFSATDPIAMTQLISILGDDYVVWDKSAHIFFKRPAKEHLYASSVFTLEEIESIKLKVAAENEIDISKKMFLTNKDKTTTYCEVHKVIYIATKTFYKTKIKLRDKRKNQVVL